MTKPPALRKGDTVGIVAPSGVVDPVELQEGIGQLELLGYRVKVGPHTRGSYRYLAGTDEERAEDLHAMITDPEVRAVICARGGYGATRLLPLLRKSVLSAHPKILVGSSDATALLLYMVHQVGMVAFHGPMVAPNFGRNATALTLESAVRVLGGGNSTSPVRSDSIRSLRTGIAEGPLIGGCLSILCALLGTPYEPETRGAILFLEDVNEPAYRIDRMLTQLRQAGMLEEVRGVVFGKMINCGPGSGQGYGLEEILREGLGDGEGPVVYGLPAGHGGEQITLPLGTQVRLDGERGELILLENGVSA
jgi:muramoyltetrapeptide carboxypeptidase